MKVSLKNWLIPLLFTLGGVLVGLAYYYLAGCAAGSCAIASNPVSSMVYMGLIGWLFPACSAEDVQAVAAYDWKVRANLRKAISS